ncbi:hypothetical protein MTO96_038043 [Rhipicephalus appendiculatus]
MKHIVRMCAFSGNELHPSEDWRYCRYAVAISLGHPTAIGSISALSVYVQMYAQQSINSTPLLHSGHEHPRQRKRLWSPPTVKSAKDAESRFEEHRCRMMRRGLAVEPQNGPGYCECDIVI